MKRIFPIFMALTLIIAMVNGIFTNKKYSITRNENGEIVREGEIPLTFKSILQITNKSATGKALTYLVTEFKANQNEITRLQKAQTDTTLFGPNFLPMLWAGIRSIYLPISIIVMFATNALANVINLISILLVA